MDAATVHRRRWATLATLCLSLMIIGLDNTVLNVALPTLVTDLGASDSQLQWVVDAYTLVFAGLLLTAGSLADRFGRKNALAGGLALFGLASLAATWSTSPGQLIGARALMGLGAAFIMPSTLSVLTHVFRDPTERAKAIGIWAAVAGLGIVVGPALGGWMLQHYWWGSVFLINAPVALTALAAGWWLVPDSRDPSAPRIDLTGAVLSTVGLATLVWGIIEAPARGWTSGASVTALLVAGVLLGVFAWWETRTSHPMLNLAFFADRAFSSAALAITMVFFALFGSIFFLTQYLQFVLGYDPLAAGQRIMPIATLIIAAPAAVQVAQRIGFKIVIAGGLCTVASALLLLSRTATDDGYGHLAIVLMLLGAGMGMTMAPATHAVMSSLPTANAGVGSAVNDSVRQIGGALGVAVLGSILSSSYTRHLPDSAAGIPIPAGADQGLGASLAIAAHLPAPAGQAFVTAAREGYIQAMDTTVLVAAAVAFAGALVALRWMPHRTALDPTQPTTQGIEPRTVETATPS
jgi:MFS transporter, DHA2 family, multidrug resistance protein